jgi:hypothetical protein
MNHYYFSRPLDNDRTLFIAPLADLDIEASGETLPDASGYFIYQRSYGENDSPLTVLARLHSEEAALELSKVLGLS